jgi:hypothetical protein
LAFSYLLADLSEWKFEKKIIHLPPTSPSDYLKSFLFGYPSPPHIFSRTVPRVEDCEVSKEMSSLYFGLAVFCVIEAIVPEF